MGIVPIIDALNTGKVFGVVSKKFVPAAKVGAGVAAGGGGVAAAVGGIPALVAGAIGVATAVAGIAVAIITINAIDGIWGKKIEKALGATPKNAKKDNYTGPKGPFTGMMECPKCHKVYDRSWAVCLSCRKPLERQVVQRETSSEQKCSTAVLESAEVVNGLWICPKCNEKVIDKFDICTNCGKEIAYNHKPERRVVIGEKIGAQ